MFEYLSRRPATMTEFIAVFLILSRIVPKNSHDHIPSPYQFIICNHPAIRCYISNGISRAPCACV